MSSRLLSFATVASAILISANAWAALTVNYSGTISRSSAINGFFDVDVKLTDVLPSANKEDEFFKRMKFFLTQVQAAGGEITTTSSNFTVEQRDTPISELNDSGNYDVTVPIRINEGSETIASLLEQGGNKIGFKVDYKDEVAKQDALGTKIDLEKFVEIANEDIEISAAPGHKRVVASWEAKTTVAFTDGKTHDSDGAVVIAIHNSLSGTKLPAYRHEPKEDEDVAGDFCTFTHIAEGGICVDCREDGVEGKNYYLDMKALKEIDGVNFVSVSSSSDTVSIKGLTLDEEYSILAFYRPDGAKLSQCVVATPVENKTMLELIEGEPAKQEDYACFVATAAFGSPMHPQLKHLRWFRDQILRKHPAGRSFVRWYYQNGPIAAKYIGDKPTWKTAVRAVLYPAIVGIRILQIILVRPFALLLVVLCTSVIVMALRNRREESIIH